MPIRLLDVLARWGYSETVGSNTVQYYDPVPNIAALRTSRTNGIPFAKIVPLDRYNLACQCFMVRNALMVFTVGVSAVEEVPISKAQLAEYLVPPSCSNMPDVMRFEEYIATPAADPRDARNVPAPLGGYQRYPDPITAGRYWDRPLLIDGYHRAAAFWKYAPDDEVIVAYLPVELV